VSVLSFLIPTEAPYILGKKNAGWMEGLGRKVGSQAGSPVSHEGRNSLHNHDMFLKSQNLKVEI
jgi:hypothetical protein